MLMNPLFAEISNRQVYQALQGSPIGVVHKVKLSLGRIRYGQDFLKVTLSNLGESKFLCYKPNFMCLNLMYLKLPKNNRVPDTAVQTVIYDPNLFHYLNIGKSISGIYTTADVKVEFEKAQATMGRRILCRLAYNPGLLNSVAAEFDHVPCDNVHPVSMAFWVTVANGKIRFYPRKRFPL